MKLIKKLGVSLWWSCIAGLVGMLVAAVLIFGPDIFPAPSPSDMPPKLRKLIQPASVHAQSRDNVFQVALKNVTVLTTSAPLRNNGQSQHFIQAQMVNAGGVCGVTNTGIALSLQASYDNSVWFNLGNGLVLLRGGVGVSVASGTFPYIRVNYAQTYVNCMLTVWYTGAITPNPDVLASWAYYPFIASGTGPLTGGLIASSLANRTIVLYGLQAYLNTGAGPVTTTVYSAVGCAGAPHSLVPFRLSTATPTFSLPNSTIPYAIFNQGESLCLDLSAGGDGVGVIATIRYE